METTVLKGDIVKDKLLREVRAEIAALEKKGHGVPGIAFIGFYCVPLQKYNIPLHVQMAQSMGMKVNMEILANDAGEKEVFEVIDRLNSDPAVHAIVLLQPLPGHLVPVRIVNRINPEKEVEGFHPMNMMATMIPELETGRYPMCLPTALFEIFREAGIPVQADREWVYLLDEEFLSNTLVSMIVRVSASRVVPEDCSVTFVNKGSSSVAQHCRRADTLVVVTKSPEWVNPAWLKPGVCIIDIYSNLVREVPSKSDPAKLVPVIRGGVNLESVLGIAGAILPIPGGLMTVVMAVLFRNAVISFRKSLGLEAEFENAG